MTIHKSSASWFPPEGGEAFTASSSPAKRSYRPRSPQSVCLSECVILYNLPVAQLVRSAKYKGFMWHVWSIYWYSVFFLQAIAYCGTKIAWFRWVGTEKAIGATARMRRIRNRQKRIAQKKSLSRYLLEHVDTSGALTSEILTYVWVISGLR